MISLDVECVSNDAKEEADSSTEEEQHVAIIQPPAVLEAGEKTTFGNGTLRSRNVGTDQDADTLSDSDDSIIFCGDPEVVYLKNKVEKPKDLVSEVSEILASLSEDERFTECIDYSNKNGFILNGECETEERHSSVDIIFTYNVLNILYTKLKELKAYYDFTQAQNSKISKQNHIAETEHDAYQVQVETLQRTVDEQKEELKLLSIELEEGDKKHEKEKKIYEAEVKSLRKKLEDAVCDKDSTVMRYVKNESELINIRKVKESLARRLKNAEQERDDLAKKTKNLISEKNSVVQILDSKKNELQTAFKEIENLKEELNCKDIQSKWVEENLQKELNRYKEQNAKLLSEVNVLKKSNIQNRAGSTENLSDDDRRSLQCNGSKTDEACEDEMIFQKEVNLTDEDDDDLSVKVDKLEKQKLDYERNLTNLKNTNEIQNQKIIALQEQLTQMDELNFTLNEMQQQLSIYQSEVDKLKENNEELRQDMDSCREREAEMLNFTEKLTAKNVTLQSEYAILEAKKSALEADRAPTEERIHELESSVSFMTQLLEKEVAARAEDVKQITDQLEQKSKELAVINSKFEEQQAENQSLKHKYSTTIRELTKEVQQYRKCKQFEAVEGNSSGDSVCLDSRTSSCNSLNEPHFAKLEPDRQTLIERIVKLQKMNAKNMEKMEFLEEHIAQLLAEMKKKNRVIQHYVLREQSGALSSDILDQHKAELSKYGGIMASLYNPKCEDNSISLELSLEINRKLQAVLEDTILKNITMKENIETLGKEIARLTSKPFNSN